MKPVAVSVGDEEHSLCDLQVPLLIEELVPGRGPWELELGTGKGSYLLRRAEEDAETRFVGVEMASAYYRLVQRRARRRRLRNLMLLRGEAQYLLAAALPRGFASAVHVYFPDPWPKQRHQKRRLLDVESVDLVLGLLQPSGRLFFATDHLDYGLAVREILRSHPAVHVQERRNGWEDGARTNYEGKYERGGRAILRLEATWRPTASAEPLHPIGVRGILAAVYPRQEQD